MVEYYIDKWEEDSTGEVLHGRAGSCPALVGHTHDAEAVGLPAAELVEGAAAVGAVAGSAPPLLVHRGHNVYLLHRPVEPRHGGGIGHAVHLHGGVCGQAGSWGGERERV